MKNKETEIFAVMQDALWVYVYWTFSYNDAEAVCPKKIDDDDDDEVSIAIPGKPLQLLLVDSEAQPEEGFDSGRLDTVCLDTLCRDTLCLIEVTDKETEKHVMLPSASLSLKSPCFYLCLDGRVIAKSNVLIFPPEAPSLEDLILNEKNELLMLSGYDVLIKEEFNTTKNLNL